MSRWHRWLALLVGTQLLIWVVTGLALGMLPKPPLPVPRVPEPLDAKALVLPQPPAGAGSVGAITLLGKTRIKVDGQVLTPMSQGDAQVLFAQYFPGLDIGPMERLDHGWQSSLPGGFKVELGDDGNIQSNQYWLAPWLLRLHFMDWWGNGKNFNQWLVKLTSLVTMALILSGLWMGVQRLLQRRRHQPVMLEGFPLPALAAGPGTLAQRLEQVGLPVTGPCNGGGRCGGCLVRTSSELPLPISSNEKRLLSAEQLAQGIRLACQQAPRHGCTLTAMAPAAEL